jgi:hypothetical protein
MKNNINGRLNSFLDNNSSLIVTVVFSLLSSIIILSIYVLFIAKHFETKVGSVDLQSLMKEVTLSTFKQMDGKDDTKQAQIAAQDIKNGSLKIEQAISIIAAKHNVTLIQKQAFASENVTDYTNEVRSEIAKTK